MTIRVRFAPSPTGYLHIGGARTALFNWLLARRHGGAFILRIEDTDRERSTPEAIEQILESLRWLELDWDEGPFFQTQRIDLYREAIGKLLDSGMAYLCRCTPGELDAKRERARREKRTYLYDGACRDAGHSDDGTPYVVRFRSSHTAGDVVFEDGVVGLIRKSEQELDDLIMARTDGTPTYNLCVVVDDVEMGITHVIRGMDHLNNTPRQIQIYRALGAEPPKFAHLPMIHGPDGRKLSKRRDAEYRAQGFAVSALEYREMGYLPHALVNYLARLGWAHGDQEVFSRQELVELFSLEGVGRSAALFDAKKLRWLNQTTMKSASHEDLRERLAPHLAGKGVSLPAGEAGQRLVDAHRERSSTLEEMALFLVPYLSDEFEFDAKAVKKHLKPAAAPLVQALITKLEELREFGLQEVETAFRAVVEEQGSKLGKLAQPVRVALTGRSRSPGIFEVVWMMGKERSLERLQSALVEMA